MPPRSRTPASVGSPRLGCSLPCLTRSPRSGRDPPLSSCVPCRLQPRGTGPQRRHPDQRQTGSTAPDCHRPMRTIWVYKGTPNPPVEPSVVLNGRIVFSFLGLDVDRALNGNGYGAADPFLASSGGEAYTALRAMANSDCLGDGRDGIAGSCGGDLGPHLERAHERLGLVTDECAGLHTAVLPEHPRDGREFRLHRSSRADDSGAPFGCDFRRMEGNEWGGGGRPTRRRFVLPRPTCHLGSKHPHEPVPSEPKSLQFGPVDGSRA